MRARGTKSPSASLPVVTSGNIGGGSKNKGNQITSRDFLFLGIGVLAGAIIVTLFGGTKGNTSAIDKGGTRVVALDSSQKIAFEKDQEGWGAINVFFGAQKNLFKELPFQYVHKDEYYLDEDGNIDKESVAKFGPKDKVKKDDRQWVGQHGQDVAVVLFHNFKRDGFFVDLAANDAIWASNTFILEEHFNWSGICIEPNSYYWYRLAHRKCHKVAAFVGKYNQEVEVFIGGDKGSGPFSGIIGDEFDNKPKPKKKDGGGPEKRYTVPLEHILEKYHAPKVIDYLSLDVEGAETLIMKNFDFSKYTFKVLSVERPKDLLKELLENNGYKHVIDFKRGDTLWAHKSVYEDGKQRVIDNQKGIDNKGVGVHIPV